MRRRDFLKVGAAGATALWVGDFLPGFLENEAFAAVPAQNLDFTITDANKEMVTNNNGTTQATCYFWIYKSNTPDIAPECPGPNIFATAGQRINIKIRNALDEPHGFFIPGVFNSGAIAPGATVSKSFIPRRAGTYLYYDNLNAPVNRVMGLHGAFIVMPSRLVGTATRRVTPYTTPTAAVQNLFNDFGSSTHYPGLAWEQGDPATDTPPFRQYIWLLHQASPVLFEEVGSLPAGKIYPAAAFVNAFVNDPFIQTGTGGITVFNRKAQFFTISGQSGHFSHNRPFICPNSRVGEPVVIRVLNAGLWMHSMHIHANHVYVTAINGVVQANPLWVDTFTSNPLDVWDYTVPYMRPPDVPNVRGVGFPDTPLNSIAGSPVWPPTEELGLVIGQNGFPAQLSPLCYPMHDHAEPSQTSQGGNYNLGLIAGINFIGDRNLSNPPDRTFPNAPTGPDRRGPQWKVSPALCAGDEDLVPGT
jgi:hypothetical protein